MIVNIWRSRLINVLLVDLSASAAERICEAQLDQLKTGKGIFRTTFDQTPFCAYFGVRYAEPPVGNLRFRHSVLHEERTNQNYSSPGSICPQFRKPFGKDVVIGSEDCLFANIYSPRINASASKLYPVMVFVHGGSFMAGHGENDIHGVDLLIDSEVLVVTFNYRLKVLGFLKAEAYNMSGNYGLKDQTTLLRWVQRFIGHFGGDAQQVTLAGQSAGAASVTYHLYIEQSKNLFHRMIVLSGSMLAPWSFLYEYHHCSKLYLEDLNVSSVEQLHLMDFGAFFLRTGKLKYSFPFASIPMPCFIPVWERAELHGDNFTVMEPHDAIIQPPITPVPMLISETATEFAGVLKHIAGFNLHPNVPHNWTNGKLNALKLSMDEFASSMTAQAEANSREEVFQRLANLANLQYPVRRLAKELVRTLDEKIPVYYQRFAFDGRFGQAKYERYKAFLDHFEYGAMHGDDLGYIFSPYNLRHALTDPAAFHNEWKVHRGTAELIANFVKHGNPTPCQGRYFNNIWPALGKNSSYNMFLNNDETFELRTFTEDKYYTQWEKVYNCLYYDTCDAFFV
ncbi:juvenile hormone esterase-like [Anopheles nili]|uniref:juvenile hormone esterase-like n=1 Tax=Anopheles nili TaxID=185578 RepID=UPI00237C2FFA|nr:juvenile hormone esterase-like [Anopheles nili]